MKNKGKKGKIRIVTPILRRSYSQVKSAGNQPSSNPSSGINANVSGLSSKCVKQVNEAVGPGASSDGVYKVPEYFCFNRFSYTEAEVEMAKYRCPQPSAVKK